MGVLATLAAALFPDNNPDGSPHSPAMADFRQFAAYVDNTVPLAQDLSAFEAQVENLLSFQTTANASFENLNTFVAAYNAADVVPRISSLEQGYTGLVSFQTAANAEFTAYAQQFAVIDNHLATLDAQVNGYGGQIGNLDTFVTTVGQHFTATDAAVTANTSAIAQAEAVDTALQASVAALDDIAFALPLAGRPGDVVGLFTSSLAGGDPTALPPVTGTVVQTADLGAVLRMTDDGVVARRDRFPLEAGRTIKLRGVFMRRIDTPDPAGDALTFGVAWFNAAGAPLGTTLGTFGGSATFLDITAGMGRQEVTAFVAAATTRAVPNPIVPPAGACSGAVFCRFFGSTHTTDIAVLSHQDVSDTGGPLAPNVDAVAALINGQISLGLGPRTTALEAAVGNPNSLRVPSVAAAKATTVLSTVDTITTLGFGAAGDGGGADYARSAIAVAAPAGFSTVDGAHWAISESQPTAAMFGADASGNVDVSPVFAALPARVVYVDRGTYEIAEAVHTPATLFVAADATFTGLGLAGLTGDVRVPAYLAKPGNVLSSGNLAPIALSAAYTDLKDLPEIDGTIFGVSPSNTGAQNRTALLAAIAGAKAFMAAAAGGTARVDQASIIRLPAGDLTIDGTFSFGADGLSVGFKGRGSDATRLYLTSTTADVDTFGWEFSNSTLPGATGNSRVTFAEMTVVDNVASNTTRTALSRQIKISNAAVVNCHDLVVQPSGGKGLCLNNVPFFDLTKFRAECQNNTGLELIGASQSGAPVSGKLVGASIRLDGIGGPTNMRGPAMYVSGITTSLVTSGLKVGGAGPKRIFPTLSVTSDTQGFNVSIPLPTHGRAIQQITSDAQGFNVVTVNPHMLAAGDQVIGVGNPSSAYNGLLTVYSAPDAHTVRFASTANPGTAMVVGFLANVPFKVGNPILIQAVAPAAYNAEWIVYSLIDAQTVRVASAFNPGPATVQGYISTPFAELLIDNELGACDEATWSGGIIESVAPLCDKQLNGSYAIVIDATESSVNLLYSHGFGAWKLDGAHGNVLVLGNTLNNGSRAPCVIIFSSLRCVSPGKAIRLRGPCGQINLHQVEPVAQPTIDPLAWQTAACISIEATLKGAPRGLTSVGCKFGVPLAFGTGFGAGWAYGMVFDGPGSTDIQAHGCTFYGSIAAVAWINGADSTKQRLKLGADNTYFAGNWPADAAAQSAGDVWGAVTAAATITLPVNDTIRLTGVAGGAAVVNIGGGWVDREALFVVSGQPVPLGGGGDCAFDLTTIQPNSTIRLKFDGQYWYKV